MWVNKRTFEGLIVAVQQLQAELERLRKREDAQIDQILGLASDLGAQVAEKAAARAEMGRLVANNEWMRVQINTLTLQNAQLLEKVAHIAPVVPEIQPEAAPLGEGVPAGEAIFEDPRDLEERSANDTKTAKDLLRARGIAVPEVR